MKISKAFVTLSFFTKCSLNKKQQYFSLANSGSQITWLGVHIYPQDPEYCLSFLSLVDCRKILSKQEMSILKINHKTWVKQPNYTQSYQELTHIIIACFKNGTHPMGPLWVKEELMSDGWGSQLWSDRQVFYSLDIYIFPEMSMTMLFYCKVTSHRPHNVKIEIPLWNPPLVVQEHNKNFR